MTEDLLSSKKLTPQSDVISFDNPFELPSEGAPSQTMPLIDSFIKTKDGKFIAISSKDSYDPSNSSIYGLLYVYKKHPINIQRETLEILELCDKNRDKKIVSDEVPVMLAVSYKLISEKEALVLYSSMRKDDLKEKTCIHTNQTTTILENNLEDIPEPAETIDDPNVTKKKIYTNPPEIMPPVDDSLDDTTVPEEEKFPCQRILEQMKDSATKKMAEDRINKIPSEERTNKLYAYSIRSALAKRLCDIINDKGIFNKDAKEILTRCSVVQMFCVGNYLGNKQGSIENFKLVYPPVFEGKLYLTCERYNSLKMAEGKFTFSFTKPKDAVD
jgi:hypothetical protein